MFGIQGFAIAQLDAAHLTFPVGVVLDQQVIDAAGKADLATQCGNRLAQVFDDADQTERTDVRFADIRDFFRSEEHTSELQSLMRISYAVFCLKKKKIH